MKVGVICSKEEGRIAKIVYEHFSNKLVICGFADEPYVEFNISELKILKDALGEVPENELVLYRHDR